MEHHRHSHGVDDVCGFVVCQFNKSSALRIIIIIIRLSPSPSTFDVVVVIVDVSVLKFTHKNLHSVMCTNERKGHTYGCDLSRSVLQNNACIHKQGCMEWSRPEAFSTDLCVVPIRDWHHRHIVSHAHVDSPLMQRQIFVPMSRIIETTYLYAVT